MIWMFHGFVCSHTIVFADVVAFAIDNSTSKTFSRLPMKLTVISHSGSGYTAQTVISRLWW